MLRLLDEVVHVGFCQGVEELHLVVVGAFVLANHSWIQVFESSFGVFAEPEIFEGSVPDTAQFAMLGVSRVVTGVNIEIGSDHWDGLRVETLGERTAG